MNFLKKIYEYIVEPTPLVPENIYFKIRLTNKLILFSIVINFFFLFLSSYLNLTNLFFIILLSPFLYILSWITIRSGYTLSGRTLFLIALLGYVNYFFLVIGKGAGIDYYYITASVAILTIFELKNKIHIIFLESLVLLSIVITESDTINVFDRVELLPDFLLYIRILNISLAAITTLQYVLEILISERDAEKTLHYHRNELLESESSLKALIDNTIDSMWSIDKNYILIKFNKAFFENTKKQFEYDFKIGDSVFPPSIPEPMKKYWIRLYNLGLEGHAHIEEWDTGELKFQISMNPIIINKKITGLALLMRDITEQSKLLENINNRKLFLRKIIDSNSNLIFVKDTTGKYTLINKAFMDLCGKDYYDLIGRTDEELGFNHENGGTYKYSDDNVIRNLKPVSFEEKFKNYNGQEFILQTTKTPLITTDGKIYIVGVSVNITLSKKAESDLIKAKNSAEEALKIKTQFLSRMSHEIRTPMYAINTLTSILMEEKLPVRTLDNLKIIKYSAENLLVILNDILDFSKIEAGKIKFEEIEFNLTKILQNIVDISKYKSNDKDLSIELFIDPAIPTVLIGDPYRLNQIIMNLASNAVKFTEKGSVKISAREIEKSPSSVKILFEVSDTGIGIPEKNYSTIFETFSQVNSYDTRKYGGTGLGLSITKNLIELLNGKVYLKSELGAGSSFFIELNFKFSEKDFIQDFYFGNKEKSLSGIRILLVEDYQINQTIGLQVLSKWGGRVDVANNGIEALEILGKNTYDIILMDLIMPELDGFATTNIIRDRNSDYYNPDIPIIALTADVLPEIKEKAIAAGMNDFVTKPFVRDELFSCIMKNLPEEKRVELFNTKEPIKINEEKNIETQDSTEDEERKMNNQEKINLTYFIELSSNNVAFLLRVMRLFVTDTANDLIETENEIYLENYPKVKEITHRLKSVFKSYSLNKLTNETMEIEQLAKSNSGIDKMKELIQSVKADYKLAKQEMEELIQKYENLQSPK